MRCVVRTAGRSIKLNPLTSLELLNLDIDGGESEELKMFHILTGIYIMQNTRRGAPPGE